MPSTFVGRAREIGELCAGFDAAVSGRGGVFLIAGEPGIGKTRLCDELAAAAATRGDVLWGRCWEGGGAPPFWPWVQILRAYAQGRSPETLRARLGAGAAEMGHMVPELLAGLPDAPPAATVVGEAARFRLFDATAVFLKHAAAAQPLVLLIDDLHAADLPSLLLLEFIARDIGAARLLIVATFREAELLQRPQVAELIGELARASQRIPLRGLNTTEVGWFIQNALRPADAESPSPQPSPSFIAAVHQASDGNPFFVDAIMRVLLAEQRCDQLDDAHLTGLRIPDQVREAVRRHLRPLSPAARGVLTTAAVVGREFDRAVVARAHGSTAPIEDVLGEAVAAGLVIERDRLRGRYGFRHALICETIYDDLRSSRRAALHRSIGEALEDLYTADVIPHLPEIAHHFVRAGGGAFAGKAIDYSRRAGERALELLAYEEASVHFMQALDTLAIVEDPDLMLRCRLLVSLGKSYLLSGAMSKAKATFHDAATLARKLRAAEQLATAVLGFVGPWSAEPSAERRTLLEEALDALGDEDTRLRSMVLARLALEIFDIYWVEHAQAAAMAEDAVAVARRAGDPAAVARALIAMINVKGFVGYAAERLALAAELEVVTRGQALLDFANWGVLEKAIALLETGAMPEFERVIREFEQGARAARQPLPLQNVAATAGMRALLEGKFEDAERICSELFASAPRLGHGAGVAANLQIFLLRKEQGRLGEILGAAESFVDQRPVQTPAWKAGITLAYADLGMTGQARRRFEHLAAHDFADIPKERNWSTAMAFLAETCAVLHDERRAAMLYELISPYADRFVVAGWISHCLGSVARYVGLLVHTMDRHDEAVRLFGDAIVANEHIGARTWAAWSRYDCADALLSRDGPGDRARAIVLLDAALGVAEEIGMVRLAERARTRRSRITASDQPTNAITTRVEPEPTTNQPTTNLLRKDGDYWTLAHSGTVVRLKDSKGLHYLAHLLRHPGQEFLALDLAAGDQGSRASNGKPHIHDRGSSILDTKAKADYKRRLTELRDDLQEAEAANDLGRAERARTEIELITHELAVAVGLRGTDRLTGSAAERARSTVTKGIKSALAKIRAANPAAGRYLARTVRTGYFCTYTPDPDERIIWSF